MDHAAPVSASAHESYVFAGNARRWKYVRGGFYAAVLGSAAFAAALATICFQPAALPNLALRPGAPATVARKPAPAQAVKAVAVVSHPRARLLQASARLPRRRRLFLLPALSHRRAVRLPAGSRTL